jgi:hypothetical protein
MAVTKDRIRQDDSYYLSFVANIRDRNERGTSKTPIEPTGAVVQLWSVTDQVYVPIGPNDDLEDQATVIGNKIEYVIDGSNFAANGDYKAFVSADFEVNDDVHTITATKSFRVLPKE